MYQKRLYKIVDYPQKGMEHGMFYSKSPGRAAQKAINKFNVSDETNLNMTKFWLREYIPISKYLLDLLKYINYKVNIYNKTKKKIIFSLLFYNLLTKNKIINKNNKHLFNNFNIFNNKINNNESIIKKINNKQLNMLLSILLIEYYKKNKNKKTNIKQKLESNILELNNNIEQNRNINYIIITNSKNIKLPNIFKDLLSNYFINNIENNNKDIDNKTLKKLKLNLNKLI